MHLIPLKSKQVHKGDDLLTHLKAALAEANEEFKDGDILVMASKVVAYSQGLLRSVQNESEFKTLIREEADQVLDEGEMVLTVKNKVLIPNAGIDNSNTPEDEVILWPKEPFKAAESFRSHLTQQTGLNGFGVLISDSHCQPLRMGTSGIAIGWAGFEGVQDERGNQDLYGREMVYTKMAIADNLASSANLLMGETNASIPFVIIRGFHAKFTDEKYNEEDSFVGPKECIYSPLYSEKLKDI